MWRNNCVHVFVVLMMVLAMPALAGANEIALANPSFEQPDPLANVDYQYGIPGWSLFSGGNIGILMNNGFRGNVMANCDGNHFAFLPLYAGTSVIYQDLVSRLKCNEVEN